MKVSYATIVYLFLLLVLSGCQDSSDSRPDVWTTPTSDCFWQVSVSPRFVESDNTTWPEINASYRAAIYIIPEQASCLAIENKFPNARSISYSSYHALGGTIDHLLDGEIVPDVGSINPFVIGNPRNFSSRNYTLVLRSDDQENCPLSGNPVQTTDGIAMLMYRVYLPDGLKDPMGGAGLPRVTAHMKDGSILQGQEACDALNFPINADDRRVDWYTGPEYEEYRGNADPAKNPPMFRATYNFEFHKQCDFAGDCSSVPVVGLKYPTPDPHYLYSFINREHGVVLVIRGKLPTTPKTFEGNEFAEDGDVRYWSICNYEYMGQKAEECLFDEQVQVNEDGYYTIVVTRQSDLPDNATTDCGISHLAWSPQGDGFGEFEGYENNPNDGFLLIRNIIPSPDFPNAPPAPDSLDMEQEVMGEYLPRGRYFSREEFEGLGCNPWLAIPYGELQ